MCQQGRTIVGMAAWTWTLKKIVGVVGMAVVKE